MTDLIEREVLERDIDFFHRARNLAENGQHRVRVGCLAAVNGKIISGTFNTYRNDAKVVPYKNATYHAEHNCLNLIPDRFLPRVTLYVARINLSGIALPSRPCVYCMAEITSSSVREVVYYSAKDRLLKEIFR
jgi:tRNA(Arg) A34 adenosine deaminase TadA